MSKTTPCKVEMGPGSQPPGRLGPGHAGRSPLPAKAPNGALVSPYAAAILNELRRPSPEAPRSAHAAQARRIGRRVAGSRVAESVIVGFQLGYGAMLPFAGLRPEGNSCEAAGRPRFWRYSDAMVRYRRTFSMMARLLMFGSPLLSQGRICSTTIFDSLAGREERTCGFRTVDGASLRVETAQPLEERKPGRFNRLCAPAWGEAGEFSLEQTTFR